ncbi:TPA: PT domain-containing protein [Streptococcus suis]
MHAKKLVKWGVALTSALVLGGVVGTVGGNLVNTTSVVYAQESRAKWDIVEISHRDENGNYLIPTEFTKVYEGDSITIDRADISGYMPIYAELGDDIKLKTTVVSLPHIHKYVGTENGYGVFGLTVVYRPVETPTEKPVEQPAETPTEKPVAQPVEQPAEKPVEQPVNQPTEKPTATSLLADNTASKAQPVATTEKKKVDNSTPSTTAVKSEESSQTTAKTLPKTGDSNSMFLVLGGLLSGLSGLGLAATSRKRD